MSGTCTILAHVRNSKGEVVESKLFNDLLHYTSNNRELTKEYYAVGTSEKFLELAREKDEFETDENGEITVKSLESIAGIDLETDKLIDTLNKDIKSGVYEYNEALQRIQAFNNNNVFANRAMATMVPSGNGKYFISVVPTSKRSETGRGRREVGVNNDEKHNLHKVIRNQELENRIIDLLKQHRVSVQFIEDDKQGGRYSTENVSMLENGLYGLIEVSQYGNTTEALAEEAGHFAVGALGDNPLVQRLENILSKEEARREAIGDDEYDKAVLGNNPAREIAGRLVGKALQRRLDNGSTVKVLANRIANLAKRIFYNIKGDKVAYAVTRAEQIANRIAYGLVEGSTDYNVENALKIKETMYESKLSVNVQTYKKIIDELGYLSKHMEAVANDKLSDELKASLGASIMAGSDDVTGETALQYAAEKVDMVADNLAFDGIVQTMVQIADYLETDGQVDQLMNVINFNNEAEFKANIPMYGRKLRQARLILTSAERILNTIDAVMDPSYPKGSLKLANIEDSLSEVRYQDADGNWHTVNMKNTVSTFLGVLQRKKGHLKNLEVRYFAKFCEDFYGKKYVDSATGVLWKNWLKGSPLKGSGEYEQSILDIVMGEGVEDIDIFHRYLGSMSNNPDVVGQIVDKAVKQANKGADDVTIMVKDKLKILKGRAEKLGFNMADLVERDENGVPTGNMITPPPAPTEYGNLEEDFICQAYMADMGTDDPNDLYAVSYSKWENARDAHKKEHWEKFKQKYPKWETMSGFTRGLLWHEYYKGEKREWDKENSIKVVIKDEAGRTKYVKWVPNAVYASNDWANLERKYPKKDGDSVRRIVHDYLEIKQGLDELLPEGATMFYRLPQFRGTLGNAIREQARQETGGFKNTKAKAKTFWRRAVLESFVETADDAEFGDMNTMNSPEEELLGTTLDYENEKPMRLPVFGINKLTNMTDLSTDLFSSTLAYASMATTYGFMSNVVDGLEVGREALYNREFSEDSPIDDILDKTVKGIQFNKSKKDRDSLRYEGTKNRAFCRYLKFLDKQVYNLPPTRKRWKGFLLSKLIRYIDSLAGKIFLSGNVLGGTVNTLTGFNNILKEALTGEYLDMEDFAFAEKYYKSNLMGMWGIGNIGDLGNLTKTNKLSLYLEQVNAQGDNRNKFRNWHTNRSRVNNFIRMLDYAPYSIGDHYMQAMSYLAIAHRTKLYNIDGTYSSNLWDAWNLEDNTDELSNFKEGKTLSFNRMHPISASDITVKAIDRDGVYIKVPDKSRNLFRLWLYTYHKEFMDEGYLSQHSDEYEQYRRDFNTLSDAELIKFQSERLTLLKGILEKAEASMAAKGPFTVIPEFTQEEKDYIALKEAIKIKEENIRGNFLGTGNMRDVAQVVRDDIYNIIWTNADESAYMDKCREINNRMHGIYNEQDKVALHNGLWTRMLLTMKGWALGLAEAVYSPSHYSVALNKQVEGFANTFAKVWITQLAKIVGLEGPGKMSFIDALVSTFAPRSKRARKVMLKAGFTESQYFNMGRMFNSMLIMAALKLLNLMTALSDGDDDDDEEPSVAEGLIYYLTYRTLLEQRAFLVADDFFTEMQSLASYVPVGFNALYDLGLLIYQGAGTPFASEDNKDFYYQRSDTKDRYEEGDSKFWSHVLRLTPYVKSYWGIMHPYEAVENYEYGRKLKGR